MTSLASSEIHSSSQVRGTKLKTFLTAVMSLLSVLVLGLGLMQRNVFWLWIGFVCSLVSGIFVQLFIDRIKNDIASGRR
jgi:preprotein translocase subunit SecF